MHQPDEAESARKLLEEPSDNRSLLNAKYDTEVKDEIAKQPNSQKHKFSVTNSNTERADSTENTDEQEKHQQDSRGRVPDGGYGWFVVLGCFLSHVFIGGLDRCDGIFYFLFLAKFQRSAQLTVWPGAIAFMLTLVMAVVANAISTRYSVRTVVMIGGITVTSACLLTSVAPNFYFIFLSHGLLGGIGRGLTYAPGLVLVGMYFDKRVGLAVGLATSGVGIGTFFIVPLAQKLSDVYGFFGTFLIMGGFTLNTLLVAMLYRPLSMTYKFANVKKTDKSKSAFRRADKSSTDDVLSPSLSLIQTGDRTHNEACSDFTPLRPNSENSAPVQEHQRKKDNCFMSFAKICFPVDHSNKRSKAFRDLFQFSLLKNLSFLMYCLSIGVFSLSFKAAFTFIPALVNSKGLSESDSALVLSITGLMDTVGRIVTGLVLDTSRLRPFRPALYNLVLFGLSGIAFLLPSLHSFVSFGFVCGLYGFLTGAYISQKSVILLDILDAQHMSSSLGILLVFQGLGNLVGPPLAGALKDYFGGFDEAFYLGGSLVALSGIVMVVSNVFLQIQKRNLEKKGTLEVVFMTESTRA